MGEGIVSYVDEDGNTVYMDSATGEVISVSPPVPGPPPVSEGEQQGSPRVVPNTPGAPTAPYATSGRPQGTAAQAGLGPDPSKKLHPINPVIQGPNGGFYYQYSDGSFSGLQPRAPDLNELQQAELAKTQAETNKILAGGQSAASAVSRQNALDQLAAQQRQFNEQFGFQKAQFDQRAIAEAADRAQKQQQFEATQGLSREQLDVQRGNKLLDLASRGETYARYMYALRGLLPPQQLGGVAPALPGYPGVNALPQPTRATAVSGAAGPSSPQPAPAAAQPPSLPAGRPNPLTMGTPAQNAVAQQNAINQASAGGVRPANPYASLGLGGGTLTPQSPQALANQAPGFFSVNTGGVPNRLFDMPAGVPTTWENPLQTIRSDGYSLISRPNPLARPDLDIDPDTGEPRSAGRYASGGPISEPIIGVGLDSGQTYTFGEEGPETVVPEGKSLSEVKGKPGRVRRRRLDELESRDDTWMEGDSGQDTPWWDKYARERTQLLPPAYARDRGSSGVLSDVELYPEGYQPGVDSKWETLPWFKVLPDKTADEVIRSYADGGTIGYSLDYNPKVFNPPDLSNIVSRGYNTPGVPLLPQVGLLTGGGQSLIPSAQSFFQALPSERSAYQGFLQDEMGVQPQDVFELTRRLAPQMTGLRTPRYAS